MRRAQTIRRSFICFSPLGRQLRKLSDVICLQNVMFNISKVVWAQMFICRAQTCTNDAQTNETNLNQFWHYWGAEWKKWNLNNLKIKRAQMFICRAQTCTNDAQMIETHLNRFGQYWGSEWRHMFTKCNVWYLKNGMSTNFNLSCTNVHKRSTNDLK